MTANELGLAQAAYLLHGLIPIKAIVAGNKPTLSSLLFHPAILVMLKESVKRVIGTEETNEVTVPQAENQPVSMVFLHPPWQRFPCQRSNTSVISIGGKSQ